MELTEMDTDMEAPGFARIVPKDASADRIACQLIFGEGPVWNAREGCLLWVDIVGDTIWQWTPGQGAAVFLRPSGKANGMTYDKLGRLVVAGWSSRTVWRVEHDGSIVVLASHYQGKKINTPNDIVVKSDGAIYWTDPPNAMYIPGMAGEDLQRYLDFIGVFRLSPDGNTLTPVADDFENPNGLCFSPDESLLYINDTTRRHIRVFDVKPDGTLRNGRLFYESRGDEPGNPDGMKADIEGNVYCTGPAGIHVIDPKGNLLGRIKMPGHATNMNWGDSDWRSLYITTRASVYRLRLGIPGVQV
jgi:gluconolactonase